LRLVKVIGSIVFEKVSVNVQTMTSCFSGDLYEQWFPCVFSLCEVALHNVKGLWQTTSF